MYLKALKLHGFKSFADPTDLRFEPGVTAIVGPNGCGKSNIADAIRWVLGEQSAKALRGGKMQDVIFEGTDTRRALGLCEVSLLLTDCEKQLGVEMHEVEITRRVSRDGQSDYLLNGQSCRLKDIQKLFMDTGVGRTSYSIMAQGHIDQILSSKPEERRAVFEEAAGITRYKSQRREALNKLALTEQNLARVADVIGEVGRQINSLRRQAAKAMRYRRVNHRLMHLSLAHDGFRHGELKAEIDALDARLEGLRAEANTRRAHLNDHQRTLDGFKARRGDLSRTIQEAQQHVFDIRSKREQALSEANLAQVRRQSLAERIESAKESLDELEMQLREVSTQADTGQQDKQLQLGLLGESDSAFQSRHRELSIADGEISKLEQDVQKGRFALLSAESRVARFRTDSSALEVEQRTSAARHDQLSHDAAAANAARDEAAATIATLRARLDAALKTATGAQGEVAAAQQEVVSLTSRFREAQRAMQDLDRGIAQKTARLKLLQQLQERWEGYGEGAKALLQGKVAEAAPGADFKALTSGAAFEPSMAKAAEALLGAAAEAVTVADLDTARKVLARLEEGKLGGACLRVPSPAAHAAASELPAFLKPGTAVLAAGNESHPVAALLESCYVANDLGEFLSYWAANPGFQFLLVATPKGEWVDRRGLVSGGHLKRPAGGIVQREVDVRETTRELTRDQKEHDRQQAAIESMSAELAAAEARVNERRQAQQSASALAATAQAEERAAARVLDEATQRCTRLARELEVTQAARTEAEARLAKAAQALAEAESDISKAKDSITSMEAHLTSLRASREQKRDELAQARLELAERRQKVEVLDRGLGEMMKRRDQLNDLLEQRRAELESWGEQVDELVAAEADGNRRAEELSGGLVGAQEAVEQSRTALSALESEIGSIEGAQGSLREEADRSAADLNQCEVKLAESRARQRFMAEEAMREFQTDLASVDWKASLWKSGDEPEGAHPLDLDEDEGEEAPAPAADGEAPKARRRKPKAPRGAATEADLAAMDSTDWTAIKTEVEALRQRLHAMGAVNLVAIEEYAELRQRFDFLNSQNTDLTEAKAKLLAAIDDINKTSLQQFELTFAQIRKNFVFTFETLFGGGRANLELLATDDPLESGIEIIAQPPGTKLKSISLLSGGQKTLTAVALLFALYLVKPSPFCLLDELDAPLDESNIGRFTGLLKQFTENSQFVIITHNKRTIAAANAIYGVTMEERGVSRTLSMKFHGTHHADPGQMLPVTEAVPNVRTQDEESPVVAAVEAPGADS
jgi:chromosome segregation protein